MKHFTLLLFLFLNTNVFAQIDLRMVSLIEPANDTVDFSTAYPDGCFSPQAQAFSTGSGTVNSTDISVCWSVNGGASNCQPYDNISFSIGFGTNLQTTYWDTICVNSCQAIDLMCIVTHPNDPNPSNDTLRITLQDDCPSLPIRTYPEQIRRIYPNPAADFLTIELNEEIDLLRILSVDGQEVFARTQPQLYNHIDISSFRSGLYVIQMMAGNRSFAKTVIIE